MIINNTMNKKYISLLIPIIAVALFSCGNNSKDNEKARLDSLSRPENIKVVSAIAKVEPEDGLKTLSADVSGIIVEVYKKEGDTIKRGEPIIRLEGANEKLEQSLANQEIQTQRSKLAANEADIREYEATLGEKEQDLSITQKLAITGADTRQNVAIKQKEREVILANLQAAKARLKVDQGELTSLNTKLGQSKLNTDKRLITAQTDGVLISLDAKTGASLSAFTPFATMAPKGNLVLHGEIDEMFANRVKTGQAVTVNYVGNAATIAKGKIIYLSPILDNKSLFYEKTGEISDRRVRRFKVFLRQDDLLINAKVECKINIQ